jgi:peptidoglycan/xylan/chitin deacetylase (PgdA/CDA1 family)/ribosomal protein S18 acetylase RimI-like enzyme
MNLINCLRPLTNAATILRTRRALGIGENQAILTFDDGPEYKNNVTEKLLDVLADLSVQVCFCVIGKQVEKNSTIIQRIHDEKHTIVNHTYTHRVRCLLSANAIQCEIEKCDRALAAALNVPAYRSIIMRPPAGIVTPALRHVIKENNMMLCEISHYAYDTIRHPQRVIRSIINDARQHRGGAYVLHDGLYSLRGTDRSRADRTWVPNAVKQIVKALRDDGIEICDPAFALQNLNSGRYKFRQIKPHDSAGLFEVRLATWRNDKGRQELADAGITPESVIGMLKTSHQGWLCEADGHVVGFAIGNMETGEVWVVAVLKQFQGKGIGKRLMELVEKSLFQQGWSEIWLTTTPDENPRTLGFYRQLGWSNWKLENGECYMKKTETSQT